MSIVHGGNVYEIASRLGCPPEALLDYSASINPLGPPPGLQEHLNDIFSRLQHYPDIGNGALTEALARYHGLRQGQVVAGNGSTELIYWLPRALGVKRAAVVFPTFGEYARAFEIQGVEITPLFTSAENGFQPTVAELDAFCRHSAPDALLFTHPGSPSGFPLSPPVCRWILEKSAGGEITCIVDEVFVDFCEEESLKGSLDKSPSLVLIRSMTKFYGIPGLRLGYVLAPEETARRLRALVPPWSVNTLAQAAGVYCMRQKEYRQETLALVNTERERCRKLLEAMHGIRVFPGRANYLLAELGEGLPPASALREELLAAHRVLIRDCSSFDGLTDRHFRLAIRLPHQNDVIVEGIKRWVNR